MRGLLALRLLHIFVLKVLLTSHHTFVLAPFLHLDTHTQLCNCPHIVNFKLSPEIYSIKNANRIHHIMWTLSLHFHKIRGIE